MSRRSYTPPKGRQTPPRRHGPGVPSTILRLYHDQGHFAPSGKHAAGREQSASWRGTSRTVDPAGKRRANRRSWAGLQAGRRAGTVAS